MEQRQIARTQQQLKTSTLKGFNEMLVAENTQAYIKQVLGKKAPAFVNNITALVTNSKNLQECEPVTLLYAGIKATALDLPLDPNLGFAYVIPYKNNKAGVVQAQFQLGYRAFIQLGIRSGQFKGMNVIEVREGELKEYDLLTGEMKFDAQPHREKLPVIGYAAYFQLTNGFKHMLYITKEEMEDHAKRYSQTYGSKYDNIRQESKWTTDFDAMAKKTAIKLLLSKWAPLSVEMQQAQLADQAVIKADGTYEYLDNDPDSDVYQEIKENENMEEVPPTEKEPAADAEPEPKKPAQGRRKPADF